MTVKAQPEGYLAVTAYLVVNNAAEAIDYYKRAFDAVELFRLEAPGGGVGHAEIRIGDAPVMLADAHPDMGFNDPGAYGDTPVSLMLYVEDVDAVFARAVEHGAEILRPVVDQFYGDRTGTLKDPFGHVWTVGTHTEDLTPEELQQRAAEMYAEMGAD